MTLTRQRVCVAGVILFLLAAPAAPDAPKTKSISVDCSEPNQSIGKALEENGDELLIVISGFCQEHVVIRREGVHLLGTDPATDGIVGPFGEPLVEIWDAKRGDSVFTTDETQFAVELENLGIKDNDAGGLFLYDAGVQLKNVSISDNAGTGLHASGGAFALVLDSRFERNSGTGLNAQRQSRLICERCTFTDNGSWGIQANAGADAFLSDSSITGDLGAQATHDGRISADTSDVTVTEVAFRAANDGRMEWSNATIEGSVFVDSKGLMDLRNVVQELNPGLNFSSSDSHLRVFGGELKGDTLFTWFGTGRFLSSGGAGAIVDSVTCTNGGDVYCDGTLVTSGGVSGCGLCTPP